jgi:hypothetical protein
VRRAWQKRSRCTDVAWESEPRPRREVATVPSGSLSRIERRRGCLQRATFSDRDDLRPSGRVISNAACSHATAGRRSLAAPCQRTSVRHPGSRACPPRAADLSARHQGALVRRSESGDGGPPGRAQRGS